jgi:hypothetical protein
MSYELRPLSLAEILDAGFRLVQTEWRTLVGLAAIMQIPLVVIAGLVPQLFDPLAQSFDPAEEASAEVLMEMGLGFGAMGLVYLLLYPFIAAAVTASVGNFYLGRHFGLADAARSGLRAMFRLLASYLVWMVAYLGVVLVVSGLAAVVFMFGGAAIGGLVEQAGAIGMVIAVLLGIAVAAIALFWILFATFVSSLLPAVAVLESHGVFRTVERAFSLGATSKWRLIGIVFTTGMIVGVPVVGAQMLIGLIPVFGLLIWAAFQAVGFAFTTAVTVVLYFDLRCRAENYDLELLAEQVEAGPGLGHG